MFSTTVLRITIGQIRNFCKVVLCHLWIYTDLAINVRNFNIALSMLSYLTSTIAESRAAKHTAWREREFENMKFTDE